MRQGSWLWVGLFLWAALYAASFVVAWNTAPTGDSFLRGLNRLMVFLQLQIAAGVVGLVVWIIGMRFERGTWRRWASRAPTLLALGLVLVIIGIIVMANFRKPNPTNYAPSPDRPITAPLDQPVSEPAKLPAP